jgi:exodeoxyribonuclease V beta subunit
MNDSQNFNLIKSAIEKTNLIEASAGTGKTYAIAAIFLRLILEKRFPVSEILVVTYTVAATEELRDRIRRAIRAAIDAFTKGGNDDLFLDALVRNSSQHGESIRLLREALRNFDEAPIYTIHGFCQRVLQDNAFESMEPFDRELVPDERALKEEIIEDFWRRNFYEAQAEFVSYALQKGYNPRYFMDMTKGRLSDPDMRIRPVLRPLSLDALPSFRKALNQVRSAWPSVRDDVHEKLKDPGLTKVKYKNPDALVALMDSYAASDLSLPLFNGFDKLTSSGLKKGTNKGKNTPEHPFFDDCETLAKEASELTGQIEGRLLFLKVDLFRYMREELHKRKKLHNIQSFDDLLSNLHEALERENGDELARMIRSRYRAALIDEFQDTDPIQYAIFQHIFGKDDSILFFIGDPKQSIYRFRGADLFAYMRASRHVDARYTLTSNWRSEPDLVRAVNTIFETSGKGAFLYEEVPFESANAGDVKNREWLTIEGSVEDAEEFREPPFHVWFLNSERLSSVGAEKNKSQTVNIIVDAVATEILRLVCLGREKKAMIGAAPLCEEHIAVLVRTNNEARLVQEALRTVNIPSVLHSTGNLFETHEAMEVSHIFEGISEPHTEGMVRVALATDILGLTGEELEGLSGSESDWEKWVTRFADYNDLWERYGFIAMFRQFLSKEKVRERLLSFPDGERRLTNVLHLMEILHRSSVEQKLGMRGLMKWLAQQRNPVTLPSDEHELRLESDARAVRIVTIHKSKGLEYPVVFCPFNWSGSKSKGKEFTFHDPEDNWRLNLVLNPTAGPDKSRAEKEELAENIRLLYVSLTRAKNRCYLVWGPFKEAGTSSLASIFHPHNGDLGDIVKATDDHFSGLTDSDIKLTLDNIALRSQGAITVYDMPSPAYDVLTPSPEHPDALSCRIFPGVAFRDRRIASFSYLLSERTAPPDAIHDVLSDLSDFPDRDGQLAAEETLYLKEPVGMFAFPRGAKAGNLLHDILEQIDFTTPDSLETQTTVNLKVKQHGFDALWQETVCKMIANVVAAPLHPEIKGLTLSTICKKDRLSELEFYFPLNRLTPEKLRNILVESGLSDNTAAPEKIGRLHFQPVKGFMKGFMDLVFRHDGRFYLVDWKSNFLGSSVADYGPENLQDVMNKEFYLLQYHIYVLALHQYLKMRMPAYDYETHFGGVFYIFLRAVGPKNGLDAGIYRDRPAKSVIDCLCKELVMT